MSNSTKSILVFLVVVLLIVGVWYFVAGKKQVVPISAGTNGTTGQVTASQGNATSAAERSDTSLAQDLSSIDAQLKIVDTNSAAVDQSLNDKPVTQTE